MYEAKETGRNKVVSADENVYVSYLALKAAELLCSEDRTNIDDVKKSTVELLTEDKDFDVVIEALEAHAEEYPDTAKALKIFRTRPSSRPIPKLPLQFPKKRRNTESNIPQGMTEQNLP